MAKEKEAFCSLSFQHIVDFARTTKQEGSLAHGAEGAITAQTGMIIGCGAHLSKKM